ncbi:MAG TPA: chemotaxis protein CheD [Bacillota bacterium]
MEIILKIGDYAISNQIDDIIKTYALGSCVAVTIYSERRKVLAMAHIALPDSQINPRKSKSNPTYFADTAIPFLLDKVYFEYGCVKEELTVRLFGGAKPTRKTDTFNVGERNIMAVKKVLTECRLDWIAEEVGGAFGRTVAVAVATGIPQVNRYPLV